MDIKKFFIHCYETAVRAADPMSALHACFAPPPTKGRLVVVGAGKGAAHLAQAFEHLYTGAYTGIVVVPYGCAIPCQSITMIEAAHPLPDIHSHQAAHMLLHAVLPLDQNDTVVALITGGGSALLAAPIPPMVLADEIAVNKALLASGAPICAMNTLRRHISLIKGGRLAQAAYPATVDSYIVSDVPNDDPAEVASGPTINATTTVDDARSVIERYCLDLPQSVFAALSSPVAACPIVSGGDVHILASATKSLHAVETTAQTHGIATLSLGAAIEGEARSIGKQHGELVKSLWHQGWRGLILSGGETTVTLCGTGKGGRNSEYLLALLIELQGITGVDAFAADTDGIDGTENNAGAFALNGTFAAMQQAGIDAQALLDNNDAYTAFAAVDALFVPGVSGTNVNDLRLILLH